MFKKIFREIKKYDTIVIVRHIGVDPDALSSQLALRDSIRLTFPEKKVLDFHLLVDLIKWRLFLTLY